MPLTNWKFFALHYLDDWCGYDHRFVTGLASENARVERLESFQEAAKYYGVARNFATLQEERLDAALAALDRSSGALTEGTVDATVCDLAAAFQVEYGKNAISAASKFLWLRHKSPVVIYDGRAVRCLRCSGDRFQSWDYKAYRREWRRQFNEHEAPIRSACRELIRVRDFSLAHLMPDDVLASLVASNWFHERVFDKFLWWNADD
jgi:hypothetical protein